MRRLCSIASMIPSLIVIHSARKWKKESTIFLEREARTEPRQSRITPLTFEKRVTHCHDF
ncbi:hypothetical protein TorRG33x02_125090, partial [Trema orientale]